MSIDATSKHVDGMSRRNFLSGLGVVSAGAAAVAIAATPAHADEAQASGTVLASDPVDGEKIFEGIDLAIGHIVHDSDKCTGCRDCEIACSISHWGVMNTELSSIRIDTDILGGYISTAETCKQCPGAECVAVCPTGANHVDPDTGARVIDKDVCVGCQLCLNACPVVPSNVHYSESRGICFKCDLCGGDPKCVQYCSNEALSCSWVDDAGDGNIFTTDANIPLELALSGAVVVVAPDAVEITDMNATIDSAGIKVTGTVNSTYTQPFEAKIKTSFFDANDEVLYFSERIVIEVDINSSASFEDSYDTSDTSAVKRIRCEVMCGKIAG
jgi:Fe-S-cluster-containing dehydrogenase component